MARKNIFQIFLAAVLFCLAACDPVPERPPLPIKVYQRNALLAGGKVAAFENTSARTLSVRIVFENSTFKERKAFDLIIAPGETKEIGGFEGWKGVPGETFLLHSDGYKDITYRFHEHD
jgi:hypothetical protein